MHRLYSSVVLYVIFTCVFMLSSCVFILESSYLYVSCVVPVFESYALCIRRKKSRDIIFWFLEVTYYSKFRSVALRGSQGVAMTMSWDESVEVALSWDPRTFFRTRVLLIFLGTRIHR